MISKEFFERLNDGLFNDNLGDNQFLFKREKGEFEKPITRFYVNLILRELSIKARLKQAIRPHGLRHAHATHALEKGASLSAIQKTLGHESIKITGKYLSTEIENLIYNKQLDL